jgi:folate-binding protein YgfZ
VSGRDADHGRSAAGAAALRAGAALVTEVAADFVDLTGADRVRFLHNLATCDVRALAAGSSQRGFLTDVRGHVLADAEVIAFEDRLRLRLPGGRAAAIAEHLARHRVIERVEIALRPELAALELRGARAPALLAELGVPADLATGAHRPARIGDPEVTVRAALRAREPRFELAGEAGSLAEVIAELRATGASRGLVEPTPEALAALRVEDGELLWGVDYGEDSFPQETGEAEAVSTTKGCYLGQEVVARIHFRGQVQRLARGLIFAPGARVAPGEELAAEDGRPAARATTVAYSFALERTVALALVARRAAEPGTRLSAGALAAEVRALPLVGAAGSVES